MTLTISIYLCCCQSHILPKSPDSGKTCFEMTVCIRQELYKHRVSFPKSPNLSSGKRKSQTVKPASHKQRMETTKLLALTERKPQNQKSQKQENPKSEMFMSWPMKSPSLHKTNLPSFKMHFFQNIFSSAFLQCVTYFFGGEGGSFLGQTFVKSLKTVMKLWKSFMI